MRRIERDERRIAVAPVGDRLEQRPVGGLVSFFDAKIRNGPARIGKACPKPHATTLGDTVDRDDAQRALDLRDNGKRRLRRRA